MVGRHTSPACWSVRRDAQEVQRPEQYFDDVLSGRWCASNWYEGTSEPGSPHEEEGVAIGVTGPAFADSDSYPALLGFDEAIDEMCRTGAKDGHAQACLKQGMNILSLFSEEVPYNTCRNFEWQVRSLSYSCPAISQGLEQINCHSRRYVPHVVSYQGSKNPTSSLERLLERSISTVLGWARAADGFRDRTWPGSTAGMDHMPTRTTTSSFSKAACTAKCARIATSYLQLGWASTGGASFPKGHFASCSRSCLMRRRSSRQMPGFAGTKNITYGCSIVFYLYIIYILLRCILYKVNSNSKLGGKSAVETVQFFSCYTCRETESFGSVYDTYRL